MVLKVGRGPKGLLNCCWKKSGKLTRKRLCKMNSIITQVHVVLSNSNKMSCLYHNKNLQPTLLTKTVISQESFSLSLQSTRFSKSCQQRETAAEHGYLYVCVLCFSFGVLDRVSRCMPHPCQQVLRWPRCWRRLQHHEVTSGRPGRLWVWCSLVHLLPFASPRSTIYSVSHPTTCHLHRFWGAEVGMEGGDTRHFQQDTRP